MSSRMSRVARVLRRTPGYGPAARVVVPKLRANTTLADVATRLFPPRFDLLQSIQPLHPGGLHGTDVDRLPIVAFVATGLTSADAEALIEQIASEQARLRAFRPVLVLDTPVFAAARRRGFVIDHLVPHDQWNSAISGAVTHQQYVARRVVSVMQHYTCWMVIRPSGPLLDPLDVAVLEAIEHRLPTERDVHASPR